MVEQLDSLVGVFMDRIKTLSIAAKINFVVTSDHGMGNISDEKKIMVEKLVDMNWCERVNGSNPVFFIDPKPGYMDSIVKKLSNVPHLKVWKKGDVPRRLHFGTNPRIGELVLLADSSYCLTYNNSYTISGGAHGYDNRNTDMHAIFYAEGPAFKVGYRFQSFENVNIYSLMAFILKLKPVVTDGKIQNVRLMLK
jgi:predicted AlkP superfamily pyrophosphatase or phosphodiesterase